MSGMLQEHEHHLETIEHREDILRQKEDEAKKILQEVKVQQEQNSILYRAVEERVKKLDQQK